jgi:hypothetical protein
MASMPGKLNEVSGMIAFDSTSVWVIEDGSNPDAIREVDTLGEQIATFEVKGGKNKDWEALTKDTAGQVYIGDFGNNSNKRDDLRIYILPDPRIEKGDKIPATTIHFTYPDQKEFPPDSKDFRFDAEALFHHGEHLYIVSKNRGNPFDGTATVYRVPDSPGTYVAEFITRIDICMERHICQVTDAALSPSGNRLVLLGYGYLWVYENFAREGLTGSTPKKIDLGSNTQLEAVCFVNENLLYLADEKSHGRGGALYSYTLPSD